MVYAIVGTLFLGFIPIISYFYWSQVVLWCYLGLVALVFIGGLPYWAQMMTVDQEGITITLFGKVKEHIVWDEISLIENYPKMGELLRIECKDHSITTYHYKKVVEMIKLYYSGDTSRIR